MGIDVTALTEATSGAVGGVLSTTILYPLDTCKTKYQAEAKAGGTKKYRNLLDVLREAISCGKVLSLYQGLATKNGHAVLSGFVYFYSYSFIRTKYLERAQVQKLGTLANLAVAAAAGACTACITQDAWSLATHGTPIPDTQMGGSSDIIAAAAHEEETRGLVFIKFRRPLLSNDAKTDYPISDEDYVMVWALGQSGQNPFQAYTPLARSGSLGSSLSTMQQALSSSFYRRGELKYHGGDKGQRGSFGPVNFFLGGPSLSAALCPPSFIQGFKCSLQLTSTFGSNVSLHWSMSAHHVSLALSSSLSGWLALGLSPTGGAVGSHVVVGRSVAHVDASGQEAIVSTFRISANSAQGLIPTQGRLNISQHMMHTAKGITILRFDMPYNQSHGVPSIGSGSQANCHLVWAASALSSLSSSHLLQDRGSLSLDLASGEYTLALDPVPWIHVHALVMGLTLAILLPLSLLMGRLARMKAELPKRQRFFHLLHLLFSAASTAGLAAGTAVVVRAALGSTEGKPPLHALLSWANTLHAYAGLGVLFLLTILIISVLLCKPKKKNAPRIMWDVSHAALGIGTVIVAAVAAALGLLQYLHLLGSSPSTFVWAGLLGVALIAQLVAYTVLAMCYGWSKSPPTFVAKEVFDAGKISQYSNKDGNVGVSKGRNKGVSAQWPPPNVRWPSHDSPLEDVREMEGKLDEAPLKTQDNDIHKNASTSEEISEEATVLSSANESHSSPSPSASPGLTHHMPILVGSP